MSPEIDSEHTRVSRLSSIAHLQGTVSAELRKLAAPHTATSDFMDLLPDDTEAFPAQRITRVHYDGEPASTDLITEIASASNPNFPQMLASLYDMEGESKELSRMNEDLAAGGNLMVVTNHGDIRDIAEVLAAFHVVLKVVGERNDRPTEFQTEIMVSKLLSHLAIYGAPAVDTLAMLCDRQYFTFPRTQSAKQAKISNRVISLYNAAVRDHVNRQLSRGSNLIGVALSGTTDKPLESEPTVVNLALVTDGTLSLTAADRTKLVPVAVLRDEDRPVFEVVRSPFRPRGREEVHQTMKQIAKVLTAQSVDKTFVYDNALPES